MTEPTTTVEPRRATDAEIAQARAYAEEAVGWKPGDDGTPPTQAEIDEWERNVQHEYEAALEVLIFANGGRYAGPPAQPSDMYQRAYWDVNAVLDRALGEREADGAGMGIAADVALLAQRYADLRARVLAGGWPAVVAEVEAAELRES